MKRPYFVRTIILAGSLLLQLGTLCFHSRGVVRSPRPANRNLNSRGAVFYLAAVITTCVLMPTTRVVAQTFTVLHSFTARSSDFGTNSDGSYPLGRLVANAAGNTLYGTANLGGSSGYGTVFAVNTDGTDFTNLHSFNYFTEGSQPLAGLVLSGNTLYGTAETGGPTGNGSIFALNTDGTGFTNLHQFTARSGPLSTNSDGANSHAGLVLSGNRLYGTAGHGGSAGNGTVFALNTDGMGFTTLHSFTATSEETSYTNSDGVNPPAGLILSGNTLYGTAASGGDFGEGTVFKVNTDGSGFTTLHSFFSYSDGFYANATLILSGDTLYGAANGGGTFGGGTVFALNTDGTGFTVLHHFNNDNDGGDPDTLALVGNALYGVARRDGSPDNGTVFSLSFTPELKINRYAANVILTWPTNFAGFDYTGFTLQSTTNLFPAAWSPIAQSAVTNAGQISVTVPTTAGQKFFRLESQ